MPSTDEQALILTRFSKLREIGEAINNGQYPGLLDQVHQALCATFEQGHEPDGTLVISLAEYATNLGIADDLLCIALCVLASNKRIGGTRRVRGREPEAWMVDLQQRDGPGNYEITALDWVGGEGDERIRLAFKKQQVFSAFCLYGESQEDALHRGVDLFYGLTGLERGSHLILAAKIRVNREVEQCMN